MAVVLVRAATAEATASKPMMGGEAGGWVCDSHGSMIENPS